MPSQLGWSPSFQDFTNTKSPGWRQGAKNSSWGVWVRSPFSLGSCTGLPGCCGACIFSPASVTLSPYNNLGPSLGFCAKVRSADRAGRPKPGGTRLPTPLGPPPHTGKRIPDKPPNCEKHTHWSKLSKWTRRQREQRSEALMTVLQDRVSGGKAHLGSLAPIIYLLVRESLTWFLIG